MTTRANRELQERVAAELNAYRDPSAPSMDQTRAKAAELIGAPVALLSTSPEREDTILVRDPFLD